MTMTICVLSAKTSLELTVLEGTWISLILNPIYFKPNNEFKYTPYQLMGIALEGNDSISLTPEHVKKQLSETGWDKYPHPVS